MCIGELGFEVDHGDTVGWVPCVGGGIGGPWSRVEAGSNGEAETCVALAGIADVQGLAKTAEGSWLAPRWRRPRTPACVGIRRDVWLPSKKPTGARGWCGDTPVRARTPRTTGESGTSRTVRLREVNPLPASPRGKSKKRSSRRSCQMMSVLSGVPLCSRSQVPDQAGDNPTRTTSEKKRGPQTDVLRRAQKNTTRRRPASSNRTIWACSFFPADVSRASAGGWSEYGAERGVALSGLIQGEWF